MFTVCEEPDAEDHEAEKSKSGLEDKRSTNGGKRGGDGSANLSRKKGQATCPGLHRSQVSRRGGRQVSGAVGSRLDQAEELWPLHPGVDPQRATRKKISQELRKKVVSAPCLIWGVRRRSGL